MDGSQSFTFVKWNGSSQFLADHHDSQAHEQLELRISRKRARAGWDFSEDADGGNHCYRSGRKEIQLATELTAPTIQTDLLIRRRGF